MSKEKIMPELYCPKCGKRLYYEGIGEYIYTCNPHGRFYVPPLLEYQYQKPKRKRKLDKD